MAKGYKHTMERVPVPFRSGVETQAKHHERHTLVHGAVQVHGTSLKDCVRLMNSRVHSFRR